jgi:hypothetical protein
MVIHELHGPRYEQDCGPRYEQDYRLLHRPCAVVVGQQDRATRVGPLGRATHRASGPRWAPGRRAWRQAAGRAARLTNFSATAPLDLRANGWTTPVQTNGHRGSALLESTVGFMYRMLRSGVGLGLLESATHHWTGQLGPRHPPVPARTYSLFEPYPVWLWVLLLPA